MRIYYVNHSTFNVRKAKLCASIGNRQLSFEAINVKIKWVTEKIVMQPTTFCNINCSYCYLSGRNTANKMSLEVAESVAHWLREHDRSIELVWHGGEPLASGLKHLKMLLKPFNDPNIANKVSHIVQTNGTLITPEWCDVFRQYYFKVGVSIDGPASLNSARVDWKGRRTFSKTLDGIQVLKEQNVPFSALCVVSRDSLEQPELLYQFFCKLGCSTVGFNIEEQLGPHKSSASDNDTLVKAFWGGLMNAWKHDPCIQIREFMGAIQWMENTSVGNKPHHLYDLFPTIGWNGDVVVLAPELLGVPSKRYGSFTVGNILREPLSSILEHSTKTTYVSEYEDGVSACKESCDYFDFCRGRVGSNKFFEHGYTGGTETTYCRNREQRLFDSVLESI